jgi:hypothetical protein
VGFARGSAPTLRLGALSSVARMLAMWPGTNERGVVLRALVRTSRATERPQLRCACSRVSAEVRERRDGGGRDCVTVARSGQRCTWVPQVFRTTVVMKDAVERGPEASFDQRSTPGDVKEVPGRGTGDDVQQHTLATGVRQHSEE